MSQAIRDRIFGESKGSSKKLDDDIDFIHHAFMEEYGWIPVEEFKNLPLPTFFNLMHYVSENRKRRAKENEQVNQTKGRLGRR